MYLTPSLFKGHHYFMGNFRSHSSEDRRLLSCKVVWFHCIPIGSSKMTSALPFSKSNDISPIRRHLVCLIFVGCGGDFFSLGLGFLF